MLRRDGADRTPTGAAPHSLGLHTALLGENEQGGVLEEASRERDHAGRVRGSPGMDREACRGSR